MLCSRVRNLLSAYCDSELTGAEMLQIRRHLGDCADCRGEHEAALRIKRLLGALPPAEPLRPFSAAMLQPRPPLDRLRAQFACCPFLSGLAASVSGWARPVRRAGTRLAMGGALALAALAVMALQQPQNPDAVTARVPGSLRAEYETPLETGAPAPSGLRAFLVRPVPSFPRVSVADSLPAPSDPLSGTKFQETPALYIRTGVLRNGSAGR
jgi:anti-sigma factor RsiW